MPRKYSLLLFMVVLITACTHPIDIVGNGDIHSASGEHDCLLEDLPCKAVAVDEYIETYMPLARPGFRFVGWDNCPDRQGDDCVFKVDKETVHKNWGKTMPALIAKFAPDCDNAPPDSFTAIQTVIFDGKGCSNNGCHSGNRPEGGMNLSSGSAYANTVNVRAGTGGGLMRILPGDADSSYLYRKVSAKTDPRSFRISGSPMPLTGSALSTSQLAALELWINAGAPQTGRIGEFNRVEQLLGLCANP